jgi:hypothetical protein
MMLIIGMDGIFGETTKWFSLVIFILWVFQLCYDNWEEIKEFWKVLYGLQNKNEEIIREEK